MPYGHNHGNDIIPVLTGDYDVEPALESVDPTGDEALDHLVTQHPDLFSVFENVAFDLSEGDRKTKILILIGMARALGFIEQRPEA